MTIWLTDASSAAQGLQHCNRCGECCANPCLLRDEADVAKLAGHLGATTSVMLRRLRVVRHRGTGAIYVSPQRVGARCEFYSDADGCTVHAAKPAGGVDFECWNPERADDARTQRFAWTAQQLHAAAKP